MSDTLHIREVTVDDGEWVVHHRRGMFSDMGYRADRATYDAFRVWVRERLADGRYRGWFMVDGDKVVAGVGLLLLDWPPGPMHIEPRRGFVYNVYTEADYRRRGLARQLMERLLDWCKGHEVTVVGLHASDAGRPLYESLGFHPTNEMIVMLDKA